MSKKREEKEKRNGNESNKNQKSTIPTNETQSNCIKKSEMTWEENHK